MRVRIVDDVNVKDAKGWFYLVPNSLRRDIEFDASIDHRVPRRKDKKFEGQEVSNLLEVR